jgi:hypothetical protein
MRLFRKILLTVIALAVIFVIYFIITRKLDNAVMEEYSAYRAPDNPTLLSSLFVNGEQFYIKIPTQNGDTLLAFGDSGGGLCFANPNSLEKLHLLSHVKTALLRGIMPMHYILFSDIAGHTAVPGPSLLREKPLRTPFKKITEPFFFVLPEDDELKFMMNNTPFDLFLGQNFFMTHSWTFDYLHQQIWVNTPLGNVDKSNPHVQHIGFVKNSKGVNVYGHGSILVEIDGIVYEMLFDTGATLVLSDEGKQAFNTSAKTKAASYMARSVFSKWHAQHPEWKYYKHADWNADVIEVPSIKMAGNEIGPVLFAERPDEAWSVNMRGSTDTLVKGAIGGSALKYLKVTVDYNSDLIKFEK